MKNLRHIIIILLLFFSLTSFAQDTKEYRYTSLISLSTFTHSGLLGGIGYSQLIYSENKSLAFSLEIANIKHEKEAKIFSNNASFIYGKKNYLFSIRPTVGITKPLFEPTKRNGVKVIGVLKGGPTIGIEKPYLIKYSNSPNIFEYKVFDVQNDDFSKVENVASPFKSLNDSQWIAGIHFSSSLMFDMKLESKNKFGLEIGALLNQYSRKVDLMTFSKNKSTYLGLFIGLYYGISY